MHESPRDRWTGRRFKAGSADASGAMSTMPLSVPSAGVLSADRTNRGLLGPVWYERARAGQIRVGGGGFYGREELGQRQELGDAGDDGSSRADSRLPHRGLLLGSQTRGGRGH